MSRKLSWVSLTVAAPTLNLPPAAPIVAPPSAPPLLPTAAMAEALGDATQPDWVVPYIIGVVFGAICLYFFGFLVGSRWRRGSKYAPSAHGGSSERAGTSRAGRTNVASPDCKSEQRWREPYRIPAKIKIRREADLVRTSATVPAAAAATAFSSATPSPVNATTRIAAHSRSTTLSGIAEVPVPTVAGAPAGPADGTLCQGSSYLAKSPGVATEGTQCSPQLLDSQARAKKCRPGRLAPILTTSAARSRTPQQGTSSGAHRPSESQRLSADQRDNRRNSSRAQVVPS